MFKKFYQIINSIYCANTKLMMGFEKKLPSKPFTKECLPTKGVCFVVTNNQNIDSEHLAKEAKQRGALCGKAFKINLPKKFAILGICFFSKHLSIKESLEFFSLIHSGINLSESVCKVLMLNGFWNKKPNAVHDDDLLISALAPGLLCPYKDWMVFNYQFYYKNAYSAFCNLIKERIEKNGLVIIPIHSSNNLPISFFVDYSVIYL